MYDFLDDLIPSTFQKERFLMHCEELYQLEKAGETDPHDIETYKQIIFMNNRITRPVFNNLYERLKTVYRETEKDLNVDVQCDPYRIKKGDSYVHDAQKAK